MSSWTQEESDERWFRGVDEDDESGAAPLREAVDEAAELREATHRLLDKILPDTEKEELRREVPREPSRPDIEGILRDRITGFIFHDDTKRLCDYALSLESTIKELTRERDEWKADAKYWKDAFGRLDLKFKGMQEDRDKWKRWYERTKQSFGDSDV